MSLSLNSLIALEEIVERDVLGEESDTQDIEQLSLQAESERKEHERMSDDCVRVTRVINELENQNEAIEGIVRTEGELTPAAAAGFEAARRAALLSAGIDPDSNMAKSGMDQAGLESMVTNRGLISLEENKSFIQKLKDLVNTIIEKIKAGWNKLKLWFKKITNILPTLSRKAYNDLKALSKDEYEKGLSAVLSDGAFADKHISVIQENGKLMDAQLVYREANAFLEAGQINAGVVTKTLMAFMVSDADTSSTTHHEVVDYLVELGQKVKAKNVTVGPSVFEYTLLDNHTPTISRLSRDLDPAKTFTQKDLLNCLNVGTATVKDVEKWSGMGLENIRMLSDLQKHFTDNKLPVLRSGVNTLVLYLHVRSTMISGLCHETLSIFKHAIKVAEAIVKSAKGDSEVIDTTQEFKSLPNKKS